MHTVTSHCCQLRYELGDYGVTESLFNCVMNLLVQELVEASQGAHARMAHLGCTELMSVASTLSKASGTEEDNTLLAWSAVMRETIRRNIR